MAKLMRLPLPLAIALPAACITGESLSEAFGVAEEDKLLGGARATSQGAGLLLWKWGPEDGEVGALGEIDLRAAPCISCCEASSALLHALDEGLQSVLLARLSRRLPL
mmetsp:Transcript_93516/g.165416  ORF Transcript_93516/g.165416 Transcript_93516/m.165416 type:complete len:108 (+) Transcript_93516:1293-1616(+)